MPINTYSRLQLRRGDKSWWDNHKGIVLLDGEPGVELIKNSNGAVIKTRLKIGDGKTPWGKLGYLAGSGGGSSANTITITKVNDKTSNLSSQVVMYNSDISTLKFELKISGDISSIEINGVSISVNDSIIVYNYTPDISKLTKNLTVTFKGIDFDGKECCTTTYTVYPGYYIQYKIDNDKSNDLVTSGINMTTSLPTARNNAKLYQYIFDGDARKLYIDVPQILLNNNYNNAIFTDGNFDGGFNYISDHQYNYNRTSVNYYRYESEQKLSSETKIGIYKK